MLRQPIDRIDSKPPQQPPCGIRPRLLNSLTTSTIFKVLSCRSLVAVSRFDRLDFLLTRSSPHTREPSRLPAADRSLPLGNNLLRCRECRTDSQSFRVPHRRRFLHPWDMLRDLAGRSSTSTRVSQSPSSCLEPTPAHGVAGPPVEEDGITALTTGAFLGTVPSMHRASERLVRDLLEFDIRPVYFRTDALTFQCCVGDDGRLALNGYNSVGVWRAKSRRRYASVECKRRYRQDPLRYQVSELIAQAVRGDGSAWLTMEGRRAACDFHSGIRIQEWRFH